jgi:hypothetical protein
VEAALPAEMVSSDHGIGVRIVLDDAKRVHLHDVRLAESVARLFDERGVLQGGGCRVSLPHEKLSGERHDGNRLVGVLEVVEDGPATPVRKDIVHVPDRSGGCVCASGRSWGRVIGLHGARGDARTGGNRAGKDTCAVYRIVADRQKPLH